MSNALLQMIAKQQQRFQRQKALTPNAGRNRYRILPSWRITKTAPNGVDPLKWASAVLNAVASGNEEAQVKIGTAAVNCPPGFNPMEKLQWMLEFHHDFGAHFLKDGAGKIQSVYMCVSKTYGRPCPICDELNKGIKTSGDDIMVKRLKDAMAGQRVLMNVLELSGPNPGKVQVLEVAQSVLRGNKGVGGIWGRFESFPTLLDLQNGADVIVVKGGAGLETRYDVEAVPATSKLDVSILSQLNDLDAYVAQENAEQQQRALASVSTITGALPSSSGPTLLQLAQSSAAFDDVPDFPSAAKQAAPVAAQQAVETPPWEAATQPVNAGTVAQPVAPQAAIATDALDDLLKGL
jgi:hypothetical protein